MDKRYLHKDIACTSFTKKDWQLDIKKYFFMKMIVKLSIFIKNSQKFRLDCQNTEPEPESSLAKKPSSPSLQPSRAWLVSITSRQPSFPSAFQNASAVRQTSKNIFEICPSAKFYFVCPGVSLQNGSSVRYLVARR